MLLKPITAAIATIPLILVGIASSSTVGHSQTTPSTPVDRKPPTADCLVGYSDGAYKGERPLTRYEFAAGMNACLNKQSESIPKSSDFVTKSEFDVVLQQQQTMNEELKRLNNRVNSLPSE